MELSQSDPPILLIGNLHAAVDTSHHYAHTRRVCVFVCMLVVSSPAHVDDTT